MISNTGEIYGLNGIHMFIYWIFYSPSYSNVALQAFYFSCPFQTPNNHQCAGTIDRK